MPETNGHSDPCMSYDATPEWLRGGDGGALRQLVERHPRLAELSYRPLVACDLDYSDWDRPLQGVREVAFLPPVSGG